MLPIFALPKPFDGHVGRIQRNAIRSWKRIGSGLVPLEVRQRQTDVVWAPAPLEALEPLSGPIDVVPRSHQRSDRSGRPLVAADCPERPDLRQGGTLAASRKRLFLPARSRRG